MSEKTQSGLPIVSKETVSGLQQDIIETPLETQIRELDRENPVVAQAMAALSKQFANKTDAAKAVQSMLTIYNLLDREADKNRLGQSFNTET